MTSNHPHSNSEGRDVISISQLKVETIVGVYEKERTTKQTIFFDIDLATDAKRCAEIDHLESALDYAKITGAIQKFAENSSFQLIETLAEKLAKLILTTFEVSWCRIKLSKPNALENAQNVSITIERTSD